MTPAMLLAGLAARGITVAADGDTLRVNAPAGVLTDDDRAAIKAHKPALLAILTPPLSAGLLTAIRQHGASFERIPDGWRWTPNGCPRWLEEAVLAQMASWQAEQAAEAELEVAS